MSDTGECAGDLRFYHGDGGALDSVIAAATDPSDLTGAFTHVEIALGDGTALGELLGGLQHYTPPAEPAGRVVLWPTSQHAGSAALVNALAWARAEAAQRLGYGWEDIANAGLRVLDADAPFVGTPRAWDCSDFVTRFLLAAGVALPDALANEPHTVTPEALARALGVS